MTTNVPRLADLSDADLMLIVQRLAAGERHATAQLIASIAELDARRLYLSEGCSSLFTYCTQVLHLSEHAAYGRIEAARAARRYPLLIERLEGGDITLTAIGLLAPHLTPDNHRQLIEAARHKSKRQVEQLVAALHPQPPIVAAVRRLPTQFPPRVTGVISPSAAATQPPTTAAAFTEPPPKEAAARPALVKPLDPERYKVQFTITRTTFEKLRRVQDLMRHSTPSGDVGIVFERALTMLLEHLERTKLAQVSRPREPRGATSTSRHIPAAVRRAVWERDGGQCAFVGTQGRCTERGCLEFHHVVPFADGGSATVGNIQLRCRAHNQHESDLWFGAEHPMLVRERDDRSGRIAARSGPS